VQVLQDVVTIGEEQETTRWPAPHASHTGLSNAVISYSYQRDRRTLVEARGSGASSTQVLPRALLPAEESPGNAAARRCFDLRGRILEDNEHMRALHVTRPSPLKSGSPCPPAVHKHLSLREQRKSMASVNQRNHTTT
jgi:hypothetical protein